MKFRRYRMKNAFDFVHDELRYSSKQAEDQIHNYIRSSVEIHNKSIEFSTSHIIDYVFTDINEYIFD